MRHKDREIRYKKNVMALMSVAIIFLMLSGILGINVSKEKNTLKDSKQILQKAEASVNQLQKELDTYTLQNDEIQQEISQKKATLEEFKKEQGPIEPKEKKYAYLTFDDGPSENTDKILDFLKANNIKATFFVLGKPNKDEVYKRIVEDGHTLALHSDTHEYNRIYKNVDTFMTDIETLANRLEKITGVKTEIIRFPGGSNNTISRRYGGEDIMKKIKAAVKEKGYVYFDWNVDSTDAAAKKQDKNIIVNSVLNGAQGKKEAVILMHDAAIKTTTVEALPEIVKGLREQGFVFRGLQKDTSPIIFK